MLSVYTFVASVDLCGQSGPVCSVRIVVGVVKWFVRTYVDREVCAVQTLRKGKGVVMANQCVQCGSVWTNVVSVTMCGLGWTQCGGCGHVWSV